MSELEPILRRHQQSNGDDEPIQEGEEPGVRTEARNGDDQPDLPAPPPEEPRAQ